MKKQITIIILALLLISCGSNEQKASSENVGEENTDQISAENKIETKSLKGRTMLCKLNGEDWGYTKASGIVFREKTNGKRTAIFTFNNKLQKGKESLQVEYLIDEQKITRIIMNKKWMDLSGKLNGTLYCLLRENNSYMGSLKLNGSVSVHNGFGSGKGQFVADNQFDKNEFDKKYHYVEVTDLHFENIQYSDLDAAKKKMESLVGDN